MIRDEDIANLNEQIFKLNEQNLDLKFEKETFDLKKARLETRIKDLEDYKLKASAYSAQMKSKYEEDLEQIREKTAKLTGEEFSQKPGESVKLRNKTTKSVAELEAVIDTLRRVIDKQRNEVDSFRKENTELNQKLENSANEPAMRRRIEALEQALHSSEMKETNTLENERNLKRMISANKQLREDMNREIDRYNLLE
jgi:chromosome segregation ATPase